MEHKEYNDAIVDVKYLDASIRCIQGLIDGIEEAHKEITSINNQIGGIIQDSVYDRFNETLENSAKRIVENITDIEGILTELKGYENQCEGYLRKGGF